MAPRHARICSSMAVDLHYRNGSPSRSQMRSSMVADLLHSADSNPRAVKKIHLSRQGALLLALCEILFLLMQLRLHLLVRLLHPSQHLPDLRRELH